jgi:mannose-6-phosphate isomerase
VAAIELRRRAVERIWGRTQLPAPFEGLGDGNTPIGEIWFEAPGGRRPELLVKYLFTSERLSIQVHPGAGDAKPRGPGPCKNEAWHILETEPGSTIGLGLTRRIEGHALRAAALSGEIEQLLDWREVAAGEILYCPAGTIHAIGGGLSLIEIQQNCDVTYRLYDYGRARELHLDEAVSAARAEPWTAPAAPRRPAEGRAVHVEGGSFVLERWSGARVVDLDDETTLVPLADCGTLDGQRLQAGAAWMTEGSARLELTPGSDLLVAYPGAETRA